MVDKGTSSVIISGGTQGLGMAVAETLIAQGCTCLTITGRDADKGEAAADLLGKGGVDCLFVACDVASIEDCEVVVSRALAHHGFVNGLVNCAADTSRRHRAPEGRAGSTDWTD